VGWLLALLAWGVPAVSWGQLGTQRVPAAEYYTGFAPFMDGDFVTARRIFESAPRTKSTEGVWIDSVPYHTMIGECHYQMGNLGAALEQYTAAVQVYLRFQDWLLRLDSPTPLQLAKRVPRTPPTWGTSARGIRLAQVPDNLGSLRGNSPEQNMQAIQQGGVVSQQYVLQIDAEEIVRCTALALRRRLEILGPACEHDVISGNLVTALSRRPAPPNSWMQAWISLQLGLAYAGKGRTPDAVNELKMSLLMNGMDHNLTSVAMLELGKLAFRAGDFAAAGNYFMEATYSGALFADEDFNQYSVLTEAFRWALVTHLVMGKRDFFAPLGPASEWARRSQSHILEAGVLLAAAENNAAIGDAVAARAMLERAAVVMRRRECGQGEIGARYQYLSAHTYYLQGDAKRGIPALADAIKFERAGGSRRLFQIVLVDKLFGAGNITTRQAGLLYEEVLRNSTPRDWATDPLECLAVEMIPHVPAFENWMHLVLERKEKDTALQIGESLRRHRFYTNLPVGGRVMNLRWLLDSPSESLSDAARMQRQGLENRYPQYGQLSAESQQLRAELAAMPAVPEEGDQKQRHAEIQTRLAEIGILQERILWGIGLGRDAGEYVFPPVLEVSAVQQRLQPGQRVLVFQNTSRATYAFMLSKESYESWQIEAPTKIKANVAKLLRDFGQMDRNQPLAVKDLSGLTWKDTAAEILQQLTGNAPAEAWDEIEELVIIPDGMLWYVPFEALQIAKGDTKIALIDKVRMRYVPTLSLAIPDNAPRKREAHTTVVLGELFAKSNETLAQEVATDLQKDDPNVKTIAAKPTPPVALVAKATDRLVVLSDLDNDLKASFDWSPVPADRGKTAGTLGDWMASPWGGPDQVVLPGFHTSAENGLKKGGTGEELFLAVCGFMSTGTRTILLSRWRDGGRTSYELMREFVRELPHTTAAEAWQRSVRLAIDADLDFSQEPRVKSPPADTTLKADHPFFWSGYLLVDTGVNPNKEEAKEEAKVEAKKEVMEPAKEAAKEEAAKEEGGKEEAKAMPGDLEEDEKDAAEDADSDKEDARKKDANAGKESDKGRAKEPAKGTKKG
jgi:tetratricopeptide (TPR) repeat protein